jgi:hypothetical protein
MPINKTVTLSATGVTKIATAYQGQGAGGWYLIFTGSGWTGSIVLGQDQNAPGSVSQPIASGSLTTVAYFDPTDGSTVSAGTAITATGNWQVGNVGFDLYLNYTHTAGSVTVSIQPASELVTQAPPGLPLAAGDVTRGTFGSAIPDTGTYGFPSGYTFVTKGVSTTALATPSALAATAFNAFASTVSGATLMGFGTTGDVTLKNRAGTDVIVVTSNTLNVTMAGAVAVAGIATFSVPIAFSIAQAASVGTTPGTAGTAETITLGQGGNTTIATTGTGGKGANFTVTTGAGGTAAVAVTAGTGGAGGDYTIATGAGAASAVTGSGTGTGGKGGAIAFTSGVGGATSVSTGVNVGGASGAITWTTAAGGASTNGSTNTGGASGVVTIATGDGGAGATAQGNSGAINLTTGASTATVGAVNLNPGGLALVGCTWISATVGLVTIGGTYGAGVASMRYNGLTTAAVSNQVGTLTNAPVAGNAAFWMPVSIAGTIRYIPCW